MPSPFFSIIIPLYNKEGSIRDTMESLEAQSFTDYEIIVVDDGSVDNGPHILKNLKHPKLHLIHQKNAGVSAARNTGIQHAKGKAIAFLDADDAWKPGHLSNLHQLYAAFPGCGLYATAYEEHFTNGRIKNHNFGFPIEFQGIINRFFLHASRYPLPVWTSAISVPRTVFDNIGFFDTGLQRGEDNDLWFRIALKEPVAFINKTTAIYKKDNPTIKRLTTTKKTKPNTQKSYYWLLRERKKEYFKTGHIRDVDLFLGSVFIYKTLVALSQGRYKQAKSQLQELKKMQLPCSCHARNLLWRFFRVKWE